MDGLKKEGFRDEKVQVDFVSGHYGRGYSVGNAARIGPAATARNDYHQTIHLENIHQTAGDLQPQKACYRGQDRL
jgi:hypothetical protein